ncbi:MAG: hypothetical protein SFZ24_09400 [Planctomycetota bacterium]|nr:hypothetical protein [Planctomycetota bacterium]
MEVTPDPKASRQVVCVSLILCDEIYRDESTKKLLLVGLFNQLVVPSFPAIHAMMCVCFTLTDGEGKYDVRVKIEHETSGQAVLEAGAPLVIDEPLTLHDVVLKLRGVEFKEPGKHWLSVSVDGVPLSQRPFFVVGSSELAGGGE